MGEKKLRDMLGYEGEQFRRQELGNAYTQSTKAIFLTDITLLINGPVTWIEIQVPG